MSELHPERIVRLERDAVVLLDQRRLPERGGRAPLRVGGRGRRGDPHARDPRRARDRDRRGLRLCARSRARGGPRRRVRGARLEPRRPRSTSAGRSTRCGTTRPPERARAIHEAEVDRCRRMAGHAAGLLAPGFARPDPLQHGRARDGRLRDGARRDQGGVGARSRRARLGRRDAPAAPGRPPHGLGAATRSGSRSR